MFTHLHAHSYFSFLQGVPSPTQLVEAAVDAGMSAVALTDRHGLTGAIEFYEACFSAGIKPLLGLEVMISNPRVPRKGIIVVLLAQDMIGWASLCRLSSTLLTDPETIKTGLLSFEFLAENTGGLLCLTGGLDGQVSKWIQTGEKERVEDFLQQIKLLFPKRLYVEIQILNDSDEAVTYQLVHLAQRVGIPIVATNNVHYLKPEQASFQRVLTGMRLNCPLVEIPNGEIAPFGSFFATETEMKKRFRDFPDALHTTQEVAEQCNLELPLGRPHYPELDLPSGKSVEMELRNRAYQGARKRYTTITPEIDSRLNHEISVIESRGYAPLFLIMADIILFAQHSDIPTASRGSAASSLVAHCLGITTPDPIELNLYFERFLNPARSSPPDVDTDLCSRRRDSVIQYVFDTYGKKRVAMVATINRFRQRSALREVAKTFGLPANSIRKLVNALPRRGWGPPRRSRGSKSNPFTELITRFRGAPYSNIFQHAKTILDFPRHLSIHPGGVVIAPGVLTDLVPTQLSTKGVIITQFDLRAIERLGLVKIDLLGNRGLSVHGDVADYVRMGKPQLTRLEVLENIPETDPKTADMVRNGKTIGCFQIESPGMQATLKEIQARNVEDIMIALALYRPGPQSGGLKDEFVQRHLGRQSVSYLHPALESLLEETHGVILYQEQVLRVAHELAGLTLEDADLLRRAMSHFDPGKQMQTLKQRFISGAKLSKGVPPGIGEKIWELMAAFSGYGFPKAHAASYAQIAWRSAWCKAHYPAEFMAAVLANWGGYYRQDVYLNEAIDLGLQVKPPHINMSQRHFSVTELAGGKVLFMGLDQVRDLTYKTQERIQMERPFKSIGDFLSRADPRPLEAENLVKIGALDGMGNIPDLLGRLKSTGWQRGQMNLFQPDPDEKEDWPAEKKAAAQKKVLGISLLGGLWV